MRFVIKNRSTPQLKAKALGKPQPEFEGLKARELVVPFLESFMHLFVEYYVDVSEERQRELDLCMHKNLQNQNFASVNVFGRTADLHKLPDYPNTVKYVRDERMKYSDFFSYANMLKEGSLCVIANADIYFDDTLSYLKTHDMKDVFIALTRWDVTAKGESVFMNRPDSADAWVFQTPISERAVSGADFSLGRPGCDNRLAYVMKHSGYTLENPSLTIVTHHLHLTNKRNYTTEDRVAGPYVPHLNPHKLGEKS